MTNGVDYSIIVGRHDETQSHRGVEQLVAHRAHNPKVVRFKSHPRNQRGGVAQLARAFGSYPECHWFESDRRYHQESLVNQGFLLFCPESGMGEYDTHTLEIVFFCTKRIFEEPSNAYAVSVCGLFLCARNLHKTV